MSRRPPATVAELNRRILDDNHRRLIDAFQAATRAHTRLAMTPRWRRRRRRLLEAERNRLCAQADSVRERLGVLRDAPGLLDTLERIDPTA